MTKAIIHRLKLNLSNAYLIKADSCILVDSGSEKDKKQILKAIQTHGISPEDIKLILHTHIHSDHVGSTHLLKQSLRAPAAYHAADEVLMQQAHNGSLNGIGLRGKFFAKIFSNTSFNAFKSEITVKDNMRLDEFGIPAKIIHTPGHTKGSISIVLDNGEAIIGDLLMGGYMGGNLLPKKPNYQYFAENKQILHQSMRKIAKLGIKRYYVGHGGPIDGIKTNTWINKHAN